MKTHKIILLSLFTPLILLSGCNKQDIAKNTETEKKAQEIQSYEFENEKEAPFSLELPADYSVQNNSIQAKTENTFPTIYYDFSKEAPETKIESFLEKEREFQASNCKQKEACPTVSEGEKVGINNYEALSYWVQHKSIDPAKEGAYMNNYHYSFDRGENFVHFWIYAAELEKPEEAEKKFEEIIKTISFKEIQNKKENASTTEV